MEKPYFDDSHGVGCPRRLGLGSAQRPCTCSWCNGCGEHLSSGLLTWKLCHLCQLFEEQEECASAEQQN